MSTAVNNRTPRELRSAMEDVRIAIESVTEVRDALTKRLNYLGPHIDHLATRIAALQSERETLCDEEEDTRCRLRGFKACEALLSREDTALRDEAELRVGTELLLEVTT